MDLMTGAAHDVERRRQFVVDVVEGGRRSKMSCRKRRWS